MFLMGVDVKKISAKFFYFTTALCLIFVLFAIPVCSSDETVKIGVTLSLTGKFSVMGNAQMNGFKIWEMHVNEKRGLLGRKVKLIIYDDKSEAETAKGLYEQMIVKENVHFLFGPYSSPITHAVLPIAEKYDYPLLISGAGADSLWEKDYKNAIGIYTPSGRVSHGFLELLVRNNIKKLSVIYADDSHSTEVAKGSISFAKKLGLEIIISESFKKDTRDLTYLAKKIKNSGAEALIVGGHLNEAIDMRTALKAINYYPKAYYASVGATLDDYYQKLGRDANYTFSSSLWELKANFPGARKFHEDYLNTYKEPPSYHSALAYASGQVLEEAVRRSAAFERKKVRNTLFKMDMITIIGRYGIVQTGRQVRQHVYITQWQKGKKEIVWPEKLATAKPVFK